MLYNISILIGYVVWLFVPVFYFIYVGHNYPVYSDFFPFYFTLWFFSLPVGKVLIDWVINRWRNRVMEKG